MGDLGPGFSGAIGEAAMNLANARSAVRAEAAKICRELMSLILICCTLVLLTSVMRMWIHWFEISAKLGSYRAAGTLAAVTGAALIVSWWLNTGNE
jgi:hypothetical protein